MFIQPKRPPPAPRRNGYETGLVTPKGFRIQRVAGFTVSCGLLEYMKEEFPGATVHLRERPTLRLVGRPETSNVFATTDVLDTMTRDEVVKAVWEAGTEEVEQAIDVPLLHFFSERPPNMRDTLKINAMLDDNPARTIRTNRRAYLGELGRLSQTGLSRLSYVKDVTLGVIDGPDYEVAAAEFVRALTEVKPDDVHLHAAKPAGEAHLFPNP